MKLSHSQPEPLGLRDIDLPRAKYFYWALASNKDAFDDYTIFDYDEFISFVFSPMCISMEIGDGVGLTTLVFDGNMANAYVQMILLDYKFREDICRRVCNIAYNLGANRCTSTITEDRHKARVLVEGLGFKKEGTWRGAFYRGGRYLDVDVYGLLKEECSWRQQQQ